MAKFCQNCGSALTEGTKFCPSCGTPVAQSAQPTQQQPSQQPQQQPKPYTPKPQVKIPEEFAQQNAARAQQKAAPAQKKKGKGGLIAVVSLGGLIAVVSLVLVAAIVLGVFGFRDGGWFRGSGKQTVEVKTLNPNLTAEVTVKETKIPHGLDDKDKFETVGTWYDVGSEGYDGLPLSGDVLLTVSVPGKLDKEDIGSYVFVYYDEENGEYRYLFPDSYDLSAGTMTIDLPHFSLWGTAKLTEEEQIEAFLDSYSTKLAVESGKNQQAAAMLEPYVRAKVEAMGLTKQAAEDLIQSTVNFLGGSFTGDNAPYIEMSTKYVTTVTRGFFDGDKDAAMNGLEDAVNDALLNGWDELGFSDRLDEVLGSEFAGSTTSTLLSSSSGIARMAGYMAGGDMKEAMKELGGVMKGVHPAVEFTTNAVAFLASAANTGFTYWKSNQIEELYQIYKNGAEDIWRNYVIAGDRETFLEYLNTSSGFTMAKGVKRFYDLDKVGEICEKYGWSYRTYEELPERYRDIFQQRAENGLMEYFALRLQQEKTAEQIKASERACIETMMNSSYGALCSSNYGKFFGEQSPDDFNLTARLERLVNVRRIVSQYVDEDELARTSKIGSFNYGDVLNWWVKYKSEYPREEALQLFLQELQKYNLLKPGMEKLIREDPTEDDKPKEENGYWRLKETNVTPLEDEIGTDGYASYYYSASELSHTKRVSQPSTVYHGAGSATLTVTCSAPPQIIRPGEDVIMHLSVDGSYSGYYLLWSASGSVYYGAPNDERNAIMYNGGTRFAALEEGGKEYVYLDPYGNDPSPETTVVHVFDKGTRAGSEMAILFYSNAANTLWIYEWVE